MRSRILLTQGVVTPNMEAATMRRFVAAGASCPTMPQMAPAALERIRRDNRFRPAISTGEYMSVTSLTPTYGATSPDATVETISFGTPVGNVCIAAAAMFVPPPPPSASAPWNRPASRNCGARRHAPRIMTSTASPRSRRARNALRESPPAAATSSAEMSGANPGSPSTPASIVSVSKPRSRMRSRTYSYSVPFVSSVPMSKIVRGMTAARDQFEEG